MITVHYGEDSMQLDLNEASLKTIRSRARAINVPDGAKVQLKTHNDQGEEVMEPITDDGFLVDSVRHMYEEGVGPEVYFKRKAGAKA